jgi:hypothetical protein
LTKLEDVMDPVRASLRASWHNASGDDTLRIWDAASGVQLAPSWYLLRLGSGDSDRAALDLPRSRIIRCSIEAWRYLGRVTPGDAAHAPEWLPAKASDRSPYRTIEAVSGRFSVN